MLEILFFKIVRIGYEILVTFALIAVYRRYRKAIQDNNLNLPTNIITICFNYFNKLKG